MTRDEWKARYAARIMERTDMDAVDAADIAEVGAECHEQNESAAGCKVDWDDKWAIPEDMADEELSYWDNDE